MSDQREAERQALVADVLATPDDDVPRLIYADWLEDGGDAVRAEFVRLQCCLAKLRQPEEKTYRPLVVKDEDDAARQRCVLCRRLGGGLCEWHSLAFRERELMDAGLATWNNSPSWVEEWTWRRGFVDRVKVKLKDWMNHGALLLGEHPAARINVSDKKAIHTGTTFGWWAWSDGRPDRWEMTLPRDVWSLLEYATDVISGYKWFATRASADAALSDALLEYARKRKTFQGSRGAVMMGNVAMPVKSWRASL